jgi:hypothetical protein
MFKEFYDVTVRTFETDFKKEKRTAVLPRFGKEYWLGYHSDWPIWNSKSVHGIYTGYDNNEHFFMNLRRDNEIEIYACPLASCFLVWYDEEGSAIGADSRGLMSAGKEKDYAVQMLKRIKARNNQSLEEIAAIR